MFFALVAVVVIIPKYFVLIELSCIRIDPRQRFDIVRLAFFALEDKRRHIALMKENRLSEPEGLVHRPPFASSRPNPKDESSSSF